MDLSCPVPHRDDELIRLAHGDGAKLSRKLLHDLVLPLLSNPFLEPLLDGALLPGRAGQLVVTTDSHVVHPLFFPGGDIGRLAVCGTVNDLAVCGALPQYLTLGLIIEEGLPIATLRQVLESVAAAAHECGVCIVAGDTKVVPRGAADQLFINTTGVGYRSGGPDWTPSNVRAGDAILVTGTLANHGIAILGARELIDLGDAIRSDVAPLHELLGLLHGLGPEVRFARDATRGGVAAVLHEVAESAATTIIIDEQSVPVEPAVRGACELLGLDPLFIANEGVAVLFVAPAATATVLAKLRSHRLGKSAVVIGAVTKTGTAADVHIRGSLGVVRVLDEPAASPLPRIC